VNQIKTVRNSISFSALLRFFVKKGFLASSIGKLSLRKEEENKTQLIQKSHFASHNCSKKN